MNALIIDDERSARNVLRILIEENCPNIKTVHEATDLMEGIETIKRELPSIVFLDIEMPGYSGLEIFNYLNRDDYQFEIIFTTAYNEYAIQAFQLAAIDYLLKPVRGEQIKNAVKKAITFLGNNQIFSRLNELKTGLSKEKFSKIGLPYSDGIKFVELTDIIMMEADGMYTNIDLRGGDTFVVSKPLKHFADLLKDHPIFYRPHRSFFINLKFMQEYIKRDGGYIVMENGKRVAISKDRREEFLGLLQRL